MEYYGFEQRSPDWADVRRGKVTASRLGDLMKTISTGESLMRRRYRYDLVIERLTGVTRPGPSTRDIERGIETESTAVGWYQGKFCRDVVPVAFIDHPTIPMFGCSPDSLVDDDGLLEIKCMDTIQHIHFLTTGEIEPDYQWQMIGQMVCTGRKYCDFVSFDDRLPSQLAMRHKRFLYDPRLAATAEQSVVKFLQEVSDLENKLRAQMQ